MSVVSAPRGVVPIPSDVDLTLEKAALSVQEFQNVNMNARFVDDSGQEEGHIEKDNNTAVLTASFKTGSGSTVRDLVLKEEPPTPAVKKGLAAIPANVLDRKPSCVLTNVVSTCVNKAASHLELLQTLIEEWFEQKSRDQLYCNGHGSAGSVARSRMTASFKSQPAHTELAVQGMGAGTSFTDIHSIADELPYLGGQEVIEEVFALIARLEVDRQEAETSLRAEKDRARMLQKKTDNLAARRAREFPAAVQAEHDAAVEDLNELHWHVTYKERSEDKIKSRVEVASVFNKRLQNDIAHVEKHCPLVEEKLQLELQAMQKIKEAQEDTSKELELTLQRLAKTKIRNEEAHTKAHTERKQMAQDIEDVRKELSNAVEELADSRMLFTTYTHQTQETRQQISENVDEKKVLQVKAENSKMAESMQEKKVDDLTNRLRAFELEHHKLEEDCFAKQTDYDVTLNTMESKANELKRAVGHEEQSLKTMTRENEELSIAIDDMTSKITRAEKNIEQDEKTLRRMNNQISNTEMMMNQMLDESSKVQTINSAVRDKLQEERERVSQIEDALRQTLDGLKKQCRDEIHTRGVLKSRITSDGAELVKSQAVSVQKKEKLTKTVAELETTLKVVVEKVDKLKGIHDTKKEILDTLESEIAETLKTKEKVESEYTETRENLDPYLQKLKDENANQIRQLRQSCTAYESLCVGNNLTPIISGEALEIIENENVDINKQIDKLENQMGLMERKRQEMERTTKILQKSIKAQETAVDQLGKELNEFTIQLESQQGVMNSLVGSKEDIVRRIETRQKEHSTLKKGRMDALASHKVTLQSELDLNRGYAQTYRSLQGRHVDLKSKVMDMFDERNRLEAGIKDLKQLKGLQSRLRRALETYYKFRGLFNAGELERVLAESRISATKVTKLQDNYHIAVTNIASFLRAQMNAMGKQSILKSSHSIGVTAISEE